MITKKIDLVVPYVDSSKERWQKLFNKFNPSTNKEIESVNAKNRFRGQGDFFRYFFRSVEQNMPWINNIFLIVQDEDQIPSWINRENVTIVLHEDFIPVEYLPVFNSTAIEMFIPFIPGLSDYFIYTNDDMFVFNPVEDTYFFRDKKVLNEFIVHNSKPSSMYQNHCYNSWWLGQGKTPGKNYSALKHTMRAYIKPICQRGFYRNQKSILESISKFRESKNYNMYFYDSYIDSVNMTIDTKLKSSEISTNTSNGLISTKLKNEPITVCLNDTDPNLNIYQNTFIREIFRKRFPNISKYEIEYDPNKSRIKPDLSIPNADMSYTGLFKTSSVKASIYESDDNSKDMIDSWLALFKK